MDEKKSLKERIEKLEEENKNIYERLGEIAESIFQLRNGDVWKLKQDIKKLKRQIDWCMNNKKCGKHLTEKQLEFMLKEFLGGQECTTDVTSFKQYSIEEHGLFFETEDGSRFAITIEKEI